MKKVLKKVSVSIFTIGLTVGALSMNEATAQTQLEREFDDGGTCIKDATPYDGPEGDCEYYHNKKCCD